MRSYSRQSYRLQQNLLQQRLLQQDVVKVAVKVEEMTSSDRLNAQMLLGMGLITIVAYYLLQLL